MSDNPLVLLTRIYTSGLYVEAEDGAACWPASTVDWNAVMPLLLMLKTDEYAWTISNCGDGLAIDVVGWPHHSDAHQVGDDPAALLEAIAQAMGMEPA